VANELDTLAGKVLAAMDALVADMLQQDVPATVVRRLPELVVGICAGRRMHATQLARARRADYEGAWARDARGAAGDDDCAGRARNCSTTRSVCVM